MKILACANYYIPMNDTRKHPRVVLDYEIDIHTGGDIDIFIGENRYKVGRGDIVLRCPGDVAASYGVYSCYMLTVDFSGTRDERMYSRLRTGEAQKSVLSPLPQSRVVRARHFEEILVLAEKLCRDPRNAMLGMELFSLLMSDFYSYGAVDRTFGEQMERAITAVRENYDGKISVEELAADAGYSTSYFIKMFKKATGDTPAAYRIKMRLEKARLLLSSTEKSVEETAEDVGYSDVTLFIRHFKRAYGMTPSKYRQSCFEAEALTNF